MIRDWKMEVYWRLPVFIQEAALSVYAGHLDSHYYGPIYEEWHQKFETWQRWSCADAESWQAQQLQALIEQAATHVPYYKKNWQKVDWKSVASPTDLPILPTLHKQSIRQSERDFIVEGVEPKSLWLEKTSGTTGTALRIYWPKSMLPKWWALMEVWIRNPAGVGHSIPRAMMGARAVVRGNAKRPPYWRFNRRWRQLYLSSYHISRDSAASYVAAIRKYGSQWITGYGSAIAAIAESALAAGVPPLRLRAAIVSGDTLLPSMRSSIEEYFQCKCYDSYGQCEAVSMAMECPAGRMHVIPAIGILEIVREDGSPCRLGEVGEMVATGLLNDAMPLIRYRLGDYAAFAENQECPCGNQQPIITNLEGRVDDYLITSTGRKIGRLAGFRRCPSIHSAQLVQDDLSHAFLLVRPGRNYGYKDALSVRDDILDRVDDLGIDIIEVTDIPKTPQGKEVSVVRLMDRPEMRQSYEKLFGNGQTPKAQGRSEYNRQNSRSPSAPLLRQMNVLFVTSGHDVTDSRIYNKLACSMRNFDANVTVIGKLEGRNPGSVNVLKVPKPSSRLTRFLWQPWRSLWAARRLPADIIHFHDAEMLMTLPVAKLWWSRTKFVYDVHEDFANLMLIRDWLPAWVKPIVKVLTNRAEKAFALMADAIVGVTPPLADKFPNKEKIVAYNYVSKTFFEQTAQMAKEPDKREFDLVHLGTLTLRRAKFLADTIQEFHRLRPTARSLVIGLTPETEKILREQVPDGCVLLGTTPHEEIPGLLANSKIGLDVHPWLGAHLEVALPVKVCEYMAAGCAVVSSSMPVLDQLLNKAAPGIDTVTLIDGGNPEDYARAAISLIESIQNGSDPGAQLRDLALKHMTWENEAAKVAQLYLRLSRKDALSDH